MKSLVRILPLFALILSLCFFASCGSEKPGGVGEAIVISSIGEDAANIRSMMAIEADYEQANEGVELEFFPYEFKDAQNKSVQDLAGETGKYDLVLQYNFSLAPFVRNNYVYPLDELAKEIPSEDLAFEDAINKRAWEEVGYFDAGNGMKKVGYPFASNSMILVYNKEMLGDKPVPTTWEGFLETAAELSTDDHKGICLQGSSDWLYYEFVNFLFGMGGKVMDKEYGWQGDASTPILLNTPEAEAALQAYVGLKPYNAGNFTNVDSEGQLRLIKEEKAAMGIIWSDVAFSMIDKGDGSFDERFGFAPIPGNKSLLAGGAYFINRNSKHARATFDYVRYLLQKETQVKLAENGLCSSLPAVYDAPSVKRIPYAGAMKQSLLRGTYMLEAGIDADIISSKIATHVQRCWNGEATVKDALSAMQAEITSERATLYKLAE